MRPRFTSDLLFLFIHGTEAGGGGATGVDRGGGGEGCGGGKAQEEGQLCPDMPITLDHRPLT